MKAVLMKIWAFWLISMISFAATAEVGNDHKMTYFEFPPFWLAEPDENGKKGIHHSLMEAVYANAG